MTNKHYTRIRTLMLALAAALSLLLGIAPGAAWAQPDPPAPEETSPAEKGSETDAPPPKTIDSPGLLEKAEDEGSVKVIVGLKADFEPEGKLSQARADEQREGIEGAREGLRSELEETEFQTAREFETIPYVALEVSPEALEALERSPNVSTIQEDRPELPTLDDSAPLVQAPDMWSAAYTGDGQTVAVLDTGVDSSHSFLGSKVVSEACYTKDNGSGPGSGDCPNGTKTQTGPGSAVPCDFASKCDHGTHVAGIAAGNGSDFKGVAPDADIVAVQVFSKGTGSDCTDASEDPCTLAYPSDQLAALEHIYVDLLPDYDFSSVNMSLGGGKFTSNCDSDSRKAMIDNLRSAGIATVIASGNDGFINATNSPACISSAVSVGNTTKGDEVAPGSNTAPFLSLLAPGTGINSSVPSGEFESKSGTSMAAPHVAGAWALLKQQKPSASVAQILGALHDSGKSITDDGITKRRIEIADALAFMSPLANDHFANAQVLRGDAPSAFDLSFGATRQFLEPDHLPSNGSTSGEHSLWYRWQAPESGEVTLDTCSSDFDTALAVYTGSQLNNLSQKASDDNSCASPNNSGSKVTFDALEGQTYMIAVAGSGNAAEGHFTIQAKYFPPANDNLANASSISGSLASESGKTIGASRQSSEPDHLPTAISTKGEHSVWYTWTAPESGKVTLDTCSSDFDTALAVYTGSAIGSLSQTASNDDACAPPNTSGSRLTFDAAAGTTYRIAVAGDGEGEKGTFELNLDMAPEVTATTPAANATKVGRGANVSATFSDEMDASTISTTTFKLIRQGTSTPVSATVSYDPATKTATLDPSSRLKGGATYTATVTTGAKDEGGNPLAQQETWNFKVKR